MVVVVVVAVVMASDVEVVVFVEYVDFAVECADVVAFGVSVVVALVEPN